MEIATPRFRIANLKPADADTPFGSWFSDPRMRLSLDVPHLDFTPDLVRVAIRDADSNFKMLLGIRAADGGEPLGLFTAASHAAHRITHLRLFIADGPVSAREIVAETVGVLADRIFRTILVDKIRAVVPTDRHAVIEGFGEVPTFKSEGVLIQEEISHTGERIDLAVFSAFRPTK